MLVQSILFTMHLSLKTDPEGSNIENMCEFTRLTKFIASHNKLEATAFDGLPIFPTLDTLSLNHNNVRPQTILSAKGGLEIIAIVCLIDLH
jgi:hypothetical protein